MRKSIVTAAVLAAMCVGGYFGHSAYQESKLTDLELANVEALSDNEGVKLPCYEEYGYYCYFTMRGADGSEFEVALEGYRNLLYA